MPHLPQLKFVQTLYYFYWLIQITLLLYLFVIQLLIKTKEAFDKKTNIMFGFIGVAAKTLNSKYYKQFANRTANFVHHSPYQDLSQNQNRLFRSYSKDFPLKVNQIPQDTSTKFYGSSHLLDLQIQRNFNPLQIYGEEYKDVKNKQIMIKQENKLQITMGNIDSIQYEANNPIQDRLVCKKLQSIDALCLSIFDGHGGNSLSDYASKKIVDFIDDHLKKSLKQNDQLNEKNTLSIIKESIQQAYQAIEQKFYQILDNQFKTGNKEILKIGSCGITAIIYSKFIVIANCGDSQAIIVTQDDQGLCYFKGNQQLSVNNEMQRKKIQQKFKGIDDEIFIKTKYNKTYLKGFLQPTRTLGDYYLKKQKYYNKVSGQIGAFKGPYLSSKPDINIFPIKQNFNYLIIASDGLWDFVSKKQILQIIRQYKAQKNKQQQGFGLEDLNKTFIQKFSMEEDQKLSEVLKRVVLQKCAKRKGKTIENLQSIPAGQRRNYCDDISIITVDFLKSVSNISEE